MEGGKKGNSEKGMEEGRKGWKGGGDKTKESDAHDMNWNSCQLSHLLCETHAFTCNLTLICIITSVSHAPSMQYISYAIYMRNGLDGVINIHVQLQTETT